MKFDLRFSANISMMFTEYPFLDRIDAAAKAGFAAVECHYPYEFPRELVRARLAANGIPMVSLNTAPGNAAAGEFGTAAVPGRTQKFREQLCEALDYAVALGTPNVHCLSGVVDRQAMPEAAQTFLANMAYASEAARKAGVTLLIEPLNTRDRPSYFVASSDAVVALLQKLGRDNVRLLFDIYHVQIMEGDLIRRLERHWPQIGHIQIASVPGRREPDEGEIAFDAVLEVIAEHRWPGWIGCEYQPRGRTEDGLGWMRAFRGA
jgi:hydroxypyruvate isomerase